MNGLTARLYELLSLHKHIELTVLLLLLLPSSTARSGYQFGEQTATEARKPHTRSVVQSIDRCVTDPRFCFTEAPLSAHLY